MASFGPKPTSNLARSLSQTYPSCTTKLEFENDRKLVILLNGHLFICCVTSANQWYRRTFYSNFITSHKCYGPRVANLDSSRAGFAFLFQETLTWNINVCICIRGYPT